jgi:hypothetical protein
MISTDVADAVAMHKPSGPKPLADLIGAAIGAAFRRQGFASSEIVTHWDDIVGPQIAAVTEPIRMRWMRSSGDESPPATLVLRVEGPVALEIQHLADVIIERVNCHVGWCAVGAIALQQAPLMRTRHRPQRPAIDEKLAQSIAARSGIADDRLRSAIGRLGAAIKRA